MEKVKKKTMQPYTPTSKMITVYSRSERSSETEQTKPVFTLYPKVQMPAEPHGYLKANEHDCF